LLYALPKHKKLIDRPEVLRQTIWRSRRRTLTPTFHNEPLQQRQCEARGFSGAGLRRRHQAAGQDPTMTLAPLPSVR
jgi:hypothetical protein